jgi:hypothetical protein
VVSRERGNLGERARSPSVLPVYLALALDGRESERPGFVEALEHREQLGSEEQRHGMRILCEDTIE